MSTPARAYMPTCTMVVMIPIMVLVLNGEAIQQLENYPRTLRADHLVFDQDIARVLAASLYPRSSGCHFIFLP